MASLNTFNNIRNIRIYFFSQIPSYLMHFEIFHFMYGALLEFIFQGKGQRKKGRLMMLPLPAFMLWRNITSKCVRWINCIRQLFTIFRLILISLRQTVMNGRQKISFEFFFLKRKKIVKYRPHTYLDICNASLLSYINDLDIYNFKEKKSVKKSDFFPQGESPLIKWNTSSFLLSGLRKVRHPWIQQASRKWASKSGKRPPKAPKVQVQRVEVHYLPHPQRLRPLMKKTEQRPKEKKRTQLCLRVHLIQRPPPWSLRNSPVDYLLKQSLRKNLLLTKRPRCLKLWRNIWACPRRTLVSCLERRVYWVGPMKRFSERRKTAAKQIKTLWIHFWSNVQYIVYT